MEGVFLKSDSVTRNPSLSMGEPAEGSSQKINSKIRYIALGVFALIAGTAFLVIGAIVLKTIFPLGIFAAAVVPLTGPIKAQIAAHVFLMIAGVGIQLSSIHFFQKATNLHRLSEVIDSLGFID